jgi:hypothetical protein
MATGELRELPSIAKNENAAAMGDDSTAFRVGDILNGVTQASDGRRGTAATAGLICETPLGFLEMRS